MRSAILLFVMFVSVAAGFAQDGFPMGKVIEGFEKFRQSLPFVNQIVLTEDFFARKAELEGTKAAFLAFMTDDAVVFTPERTNARQFWTARQPKAGTLLSWAPNFADVSSNGALGYTTGNWEFRSNAKDVEAAGYGDFITLWSRQPDGSYKWIIDIGVEHAKPAKYSTEWTSAKVVGGAKPQDSDLTQAFFQMVEAKGLAKAYNKFADDNIRGYREGKLPLLGKKALLNVVKDDKGVVTLVKRGTVFRADDLAYMLTGYQKKTGNKIEKGNYLQIWKFSSGKNGKWHIVLEIFKPAE
jgi:ketosteroid isomerase-like protein